MSKCAVCNRTLRSIVSATIGVGPKCNSRLKAVYTEALQGLETKNKSLLDDIKKEFEGKSPAEVSAALKKNQELLQEGIEALQSKDRKFQKILSFIHGLNDTPEMKKQFVSINYLPTAIQKEIFVSGDENQIESLANQTTCSPHILAYLASSNKPEVVSKVAEQVISRDLKNDRLLGLLKQNKQLSSTDNARLSRHLEKIERQKARAEAKPQERIPIGYDIVGADTDTFIAKLRAGIIRKAKLDQVQFRYKENS